MPISLTLEFPRAIPTAESTGLAKCSWFVEAMHSDAASKTAYAVTTEALWTFARGPGDTWALTSEQTLEGRATGMTPTVSAPGSLLIWGREGYLERIELATGKRCHFVSHSEHIIAAAERGGRVISGGDGKQLQVWDTADGHLHFEASVAGYITDIAFLSDTVALVVVDRKHVEVWDLHAQSRVTKVATRLTPLGVLVDPDGRWFAVWGGQRVEVFNARTYARTQNLKPRIGKLSCLALHTKALLVGADDGRWAAVDPASGTIVGRGVAHGEAVLGMAPMAGRVLSWSMDNSVSVSDLTSGKVIARHADHTNLVACGAVVAGGVLTGSADGAVRFWTARGGSIASLEAAGHTALVRQADFIDDDTILSVASDGVRIWNVQTGAVEAFRNQPDSACAVVTDDRVFAGAHSNLVQIWDRAHGQTLRRFGYAGARFAIAQPHAGQVVTGVGPDLIAHRVEAPWGTPWQVRAFETSVMRIEISPDGRLGVARDKNTSAVIFDPHTGALGQRLDDAKALRWLDDTRLLIDDGEHCTLWVGDAATLKGTRTALPDAVTTQTVVIDGVVVGKTRDKSLAIWDAKWVPSASEDVAVYAVEVIHGRVLATSQAGPLEVTLDDGALSIRHAFKPAAGETAIRHPDFDDVWVILNDETFAVWIDGEARVHGVSGRPGGYDWAISTEDAIFSGDVLLIGTGQGDVEVWDWRAGTRRRIDRSLKSTMDFARAPSGNIAASSLDSRMAVFGPDGAMLTTYGGHGSMVMAVLHYTPEGGPETLISAGFDGLIIGWDITADCRAWTIQTGAVHGMAMLGPHHLVVGTQSGEAEVWDLRDRDRVASVPMGSLVRGTLLAPTTTQVASISQDGRVVVWGLDDGEVEVLSDTTVSETAGEMRGSAWHPASETLAILHDNTLVTLDGETLKTRLQWSGSSAQTVGWSGDGSLLFVGDYGGGLFAVSADKTGRFTPKTILKMPETVQHLVGRDDRLLVADTSGAVRVYRVER